MALDFSLWLVKKSAGGGEGRGGVRRGGLGGGGVWGEQGWVGL